MTTPDWGRQINPAPKIHDAPPAVKSAAPPLTIQRIGIIGSVILDLVLAQIALALGNITVLGQRPFGFLTEWGRDLQKRAIDAFTNAGVAQTSANYANSQLTVLTGGALASDVPGGVSVNESFTGASSNNFGAGWTRTLSDGLGGGFFGRNGSGLAVWKKSGGLMRRHVDRNDVPLATDYQAVFTVLAAPAQSPFLGDDAYTYLVGRSNAAGNEFVYARIGNNDVAVGEVTSGSWSAPPWTSAATTVNAGDQWTFLLGTSTDVRQFIVKQNGFTRITWTDSTSSAFGTSNLYVGVGASAGARGFLFIPFVDQTLPAELDLWAAADRLPTSI